MTVVQNSHLILIRGNRFFAWFSSVVAGLGFVQLSHNVKPTYTEKREESFVEKETKIWCWNPIPNCYIILSG